MADRSEKVFPALPQRRERARQEGRIARSSEVTAAASFLAATVLLSATVGAFGRWSVEAFRTAMGSADANDLAMALRRGFAWPLEAVAVIAAILMLAALVGAVAQDGFVFTPSRVSPDFGRVSPAKYFGRMFSGATFVEIGKALIKVGFLGLIAWLTARWTFDRYAAEPGLGTGLSIMGAGMRRILWWSAVVALVAAAADYAYRRYDYESELRMTRQEFLDEIKQEEGNPQIKRALRRAQRRNWKRMRGVHQAAAASVVLTNPTHFAVALRYRRGFDRAPLVVAKGAGEHAMRIVAIARLAAVPVLENKPLARALFRSVEVGEQIPRQFYRAIAEVLAAIMRAKVNANVAQQQAVRG